MCAYIVVAAARRAATASSWWRGFRGCAGKSLGRIVPLCSCYCRCLRIPLSPAASVPLVRRGCAITIPAVLTRRCLRVGCVSPAVSHINKSACQDGREVVVENAFPWGVRCIAGGPAARAAAGGGPWTDSTSRLRLLPSCRVGAFGSDAVGLLQLSGAWRVGAFGSDADRRLRLLPS